MKTLKAPIKIGELKNLANERDLQAVVILTVSRDGMVSVVTYGENKTKCKAIGEWGQGLWDYAVSIVPFQTVFGWGNKGIPKEVTDQQKIDAAIKRQNLTDGCSSEQSVPHIKRKPSKDVLDSVAGSYRNRLQK